MKTKVGGDRKGFEKICVCVLYLHIHIYYWFFHFFEAFGLSLTLRSLASWKMVKRCCGGIGTCGDSTLHCCTLLLLAIIWVFRQFSSASAALWSAVLCGLWLYICSDSHNCFSVIRMCLFACSLWHAAYSCNAFK